MTQDFSEEQLIIELTDMQRLQDLSSQLIREDNINILYEQIIDTTIALMRSDAASLQMFSPRKTG